MSSSPESGDALAFLNHTLPLQASNVARHRLPDGRFVWLKKANAPHSIWRYRIQGLLTRSLGLDALAPVPNRGGTQAIAHEAGRLRELTALGLPVPELLAHSPSGLLMTDLTEGREPASSLGDELALLAPRGADALLPAWRDGLQAIAGFHARGTCLSQAFARNMVRRPDGGIGCLDFEDRPQDVLPLPQCQARDWLSYLHATAQLLREAQALAPAGQMMADQLQQADPGTRQAMADIAQRTHWLQGLPQGRRWGRDVQRLSALAQLLQALR
ncbi:hypothetical protein CCO03_02180 [Comamonas serinivorans]|uniref:Serine/threonine protein phosphatase n=1 Tax=Comamonas serinivorans TaxID=1082851 RepID=A0A1Y0EK40_9BURK|nr:hypothetical protein [Comamonas serinivorans]ARU03652.1 hypothetical protein CCO03_02180 [Comamonas serinivorans]